MIKEKNIEVVGTISIPISRIADLLVGAIEGGIGYWCQIEGYELAEGLTFEDFKKGGKCTFGKEYYHPYELIPLQEGCSLILKDIEEEDRTYKLNWQGLCKGMQAVSEQYPWHFENIIKESDDAETADVLVQCAVLGEVTFG